MQSSSKGPSRASQAVCRPLGKIKFILFDPSQGELCYENICMKGDCICVLFLIIYVLFYNILPVV